MEKKTTNAFGQPLSYRVDNWTPPPRPSREPIVGRTCRVEPLDVDQHAADLFAAAARRLGFSYEGVFRQARVVKGHNRDTAWYACIDREWPALDRAFCAWLDPANFDADGHQRTKLSALTAPIVVSQSAGPCPPDA